MFSELPPKNGHVQVRRHVSNVPDSPRLALAGFHDLIHCMASAIFSAAIRVGKLVLAHGTTGQIEASTTRKPCTPLTRPCVSTTAIGSSGRPMRHEHEACHTPIAALRTKASIALSSPMTSVKGETSQ